MRTKITLAAAILIATLSGCNKSKPAPDAAATATAGASEAASAAASQAPAMPKPGDYLSSTQGGKPVAKVTLNADGSYSRDPEEGLNEAGIAKMTDGKLCFDPSGKDKPVRCYTLSATAADGSFTATDDKGVTFNVKPASK